MDDDIRNTRLDLTGSKYFAAQLEMLRIYKLKFLHYQLIIYNLENKR